MANEQTFLMIKPDGVQRGLVGELIKRFEQRGYLLIALKMVQADEELLEEHYKNLALKDQSSSAWSGMVLKWSELFVLCSTRFELVSDQMSCMVSIQWRVPSVRSPFGFQKPIKI